MSTVFVAIGVLLLAYLLGSIPFAYIAGRLAKGVDIREVHTGIVGAANVFRKVNRFAGILVAIADAGKGALAVVLARAVGLPPWLAILAALAAIAGHWWPVFLNFRGGVGAATTGGAFVALMPKETSIALPALFAALAATRSVGPSCAIFFILAISIGIAFGQSTTILAGCGILVVILFLKANLRGRRFSLQSLRIHRRRKEI